jgi:hypothetical protein
MNSITKTVCVAGFILDHGSHNLIMNRKIVLGAFSEELFIT